MKAIVIIFYLVGTLYYTVQIVSDHPELLAQAQNLATSLFSNRTK